MISVSELRAQLGGIDIYLFDQLLKGRIADDARILDAGCGGGRNIAYFLRLGFDVSAIDKEATAVAQVAALAAECAPGVDQGDRFRVAPITATGFPAAAFDVVVAIAVLHFAADEGEFDRMLAELWRVLAPGGMFLARLGSDIGLEGRLEPLGGRRFHSPDGSDRFLVNEAMLLERTAGLGAELLEPLKTVNVQGTRCMTTWVMRKGSVG